MTTGTSAQQLQEQLQESQQKNSLLQKMLVQKSSELQQTLQQYSQHLATMAQPAQSQPYRLPFSQPQLLPLPQLSSTPANQALQQEFLKLQVKGQKKDSKITGTFLLVYRIITSA